MRMSTIIVSISLFIITLNTIGAANAGAAYQKDTSLSNYVDFGPEFGMGYNTWSDSETKNVSLDASTHSRSVVSYTSAQFSRYYSDPSQGYVSFSFGGSLDNVPTGLDSKYQYTNVTHNGKKIFLSSGYSVYDANDNTGKGKGITTPPDDLSTVETFALTTHDFVSSAYMSANLSPFKVVSAESYYDDTPYTYYDPMTGMPYVSDNFYGYVMWHVKSNDGSPISITSLSASAVPEPSMAILGIIPAAFAGLRRR